MPRTAEQTPAPGSRLYRWRESLPMRSVLPPSIVLTRNRRSMLTIQPLGTASWQIRMHHAFEEAPQEVLDALARWLVDKNPDDWTCVRRFALSIPTGEVSPSTRPAPRRRVYRTAGQHMDLKALLTEVKNGWFPEEAAVTVCWGRRGRKRGRRRRSMVYATWHEEQRLIRVHPDLDQPWIPLEFMRYVLYHELCHAVAKPLPASRGRRRIHHAAFKALERQYPDYPRMIQLSREIFARLSKQ